MWETRRPAARDGPGGQRRVDDRGRLPHRLQGAFRGRKKGGREEQRMLGALGESAGGGTGQSGGLGGAKRQMRT